MSILVVCGSISNVAAARISDYWFETNKQAKGIVPAIMCFCGVTAAAILYKLESFDGILICLTFYYLLSDGYVAPILSMFGIAAPASAKNLVMGEWSSTIALSSLLMPLVIANMITNVMDGQEVSLVLTLNVCVMSNIAGICFLVGGQRFAYELEEQEKAKAASLAQAIVKVPMLADSKHILLKGNKELSERVMNEVVNGMSVRDRLSKTPNNIIKGY